MQTCAENPKNWRRQKVSQLVRVGRQLLCLGCVALLFACAQPQPVAEKPIDLPVLKLDPMPPVKSVPKDINAEIMKLNEIHDWVTLVPIWGFPDYQVKTVIDQIAQAEWAASSLTIRPELQPVKDALLRWIRDKQTGLAARQRYIETKNVAEHNEANRYVQIGNQSGQNYLVTLANYFKSHGYTYEWLQIDGKKRLQWSPQP
jgi:hypothetical protein